MFFLSCVDINMMENELKHDALETTEEKWEREMEGNKGKQEKLNKIDNLSRCTFASTLHISCVL